MPPIRIPRRTLLDGGAVLAVAAGARALYLWQSSRGPFFGEPLVDALTYHDLARAFAERGVFDEHILWQAPLYPMLLAGLYRLVGVSVAAGRIAGAILGVATCALAWRLGRRVLGERGGLAVGLVTALNGVLVFFETELLSTGLETFLLVALVSLLLEARERPRIAAAVALGVVAGAGLLARPVLLAPALAGLAWLVWGRRRRSAIAAIAGAAAVLVPFAAICHGQTGHAGLWPPSGGVNLYLGNNPGFPGTLTIRPGLAWEELIARPVRASGVNDPWVSAKWFEDRVRAFVLETPGRWLAGLGEKTLHLVSARELPRNVDLYLARPWSSLLASLVWRQGPFGFPAGVLVPLALVGLVAARRRLPAMLGLAIAAWAAALVVVFAAARYRAPLWPLLSIAAVAGVQELLRARGRRLAALCGGLAVGLAIAVAPGPFAPETVDLTGELWHGVGFNQLRRDEYPAAEESFRRAIEARADYPEAWNRLGVALARQGRYAESIPCFERALALAPTYPDPSGNLELARKLAAEEAAGVRRSPRP
ncbi:MAG TPA: glycosyltransferase family 39 protein [Candidatus Krumholzibacteria bacterium]|nr:glycosyltransferase family 39 protein [Candidatus Krumholzibacteria bacterium]HPD72877.1 glycosyltransferase family 39 protein [Candidatus Krumholzibacteria bacterium]HRY41676.1 glycosyltransferase family 39 protein [Candidatus Krumholzibacteria bacterium]